MGILYATIPFMILVVAMVTAPLLLTIRREAKEQRARLAHAAEAGSGAGETLPEAA